MWPRIKRKPKSRLVSKYPCWNQVQKCWIRKNIFKIKQTISIKETSFSAFNKTDFWFKQMNGYYSAVQGALLLPIITCLNKIKNRPFLIIVNYWMSYEFLILKGFNVQQIVS